MNVIIKDLDKDRHQHIFNTIGNYCEVLRNDTTWDTIDVRLDESVIVKTHFDSVTLDLGGKLDTIDKDEFEIIEIY